MKKIGLIGFQSGVSTAQYAELITNLYKQYCPDGGEPELVLSGVDFQEFERLRLSGRWDVIFNLLSAVVKEELKGADFYIIASVYTHVLYEQLVECHHLDILHIADPVGEYLRQNYINKALLLGVKETMVDDFFSSILEERYNIELIVPERKQDWRTVEEAIYEQLREGTVSQVTRNRVQQIVKNGKNHGAQAVIQASTELPQIFTRKDLVMWGAAMPVVNTMQLHAEAALRKALGLDDE